ncbi:MAG: hypothetical protein RBS80_19240 [Thermoguttaceae bacterium]|jgi:hypothetical protein|nr:hypothetical protein [Thermoguttaceae bacterium]
MWRRRAIAGSVILVCCAVAITIADHYVGFADKAFLPVRETLADDAAVPRVLDDSQDETPKPRIEVHTVPGSDDMPDEMADDAVVHSLAEEMRRQLIDAYAAVVEVHLKILADPATAKALAAYQRNYYDALLDQGFSEEQAFELLKTEPPRFHLPGGDGGRH